MMHWIAFAWLTVAIPVAAMLTAPTRPLWRRLGISLVAVILLSVAMGPLVGSPLQPRFSAEAGPFVAFSERAFVAAWWLLVARIIIASGQVALGINHQRHTARLLSDLVAGVIYLGAMLAVIDLGFGISVAGLVATSGIIAIVLGLALQSTLSDLFSGVAIGIDRPFGVGDLVLIEGAVEGRVIETNWRSTRVATGAGDVATVPNSVVAKARITNKSSPSELHVASVKVMVDPAVPPKRVLDMLLASALNTDALSGPPESILCTELRGDGATYELQFPVPVTSLGRARSDLLVQIARHAHYCGIALAPHDAALPVPALGPARLLDDVLVLEALGAADRERLAAGLIRHEGEAGTLLFTQGGRQTSMFVIARGAFAVTRDAGRGPARLGTVGPGDYFGELALLTGSPNAASVTALTRFVAYELGKAMIEPLLHDNAEVLHALEEGASKARARLDRMVAAQACPDPIAQTHLIDRIRGFFNLAGNHAIHRDPV